MPVERSQISLVAWSGFGVFHVMSGARKSKTADAKIASVRKWMSGLSARERMELALYLGHRSKLFPVYSHSAATESGPESSVEDNSRLNAPATNKSPVEYSGHSQRPDAKQPNRG